MNDPDAVQARIDLEMVEAYRSLFLGSDTGRRVLDDLALWCQFNRVPEPTDPEPLVRYVHGRQSVYGRILNALRMTESELARLEARARGAV